ncbi:DUF6682 family protein [Pleionea sp. CnH1-48]|uniref:phage adaptor protein n=1 Tax=Pleionea sp. CnH1-48 TaxID=2954494 RepID=UPI002096D159|nr:DUF6682 family protein [Pleionea sp. CnH1-48]MCO7225927.1 hypothetical protein [Pleionea sp. CnH1-48]
MIAADIIVRAARLLMDEQFEVFSIGEYLTYISDAQRTIHKHRPDANSVNMVMRLIPGAKQSIPTDGYRLLRVTRNMGADGNTMGSAIIEASKATFDAELPHWPTITDSRIQHFLFDDIDPKSFYVYPAIAQDASHYVELIYSKTPMEIGSTRQSLELPDEYANAILNWVLYRCYTKESVAAQNLQKAQSYYQLFAQEVNGSLQIEWATSGEQKTS